MLVSVIIPVYNVEVYLRECIESVLSQTYKELEIILIDDGSTDNSGKICDEYAQKYENIVVIHKENAGLGMARNTGMEAMHGDYVIFLDSDDYLEPTCVQCLMDNLQKNQVDMCRGALQRVTDDKCILSMHRYENEVYEGRGARDSFLPKMIGSRPDKKDSIGMYVCSGIYSCAPIRKHQLRFPSERKLIGEDLVFNIDYMQYANGACLIKNVIYNYRLNKNSLTQSYREDRFEAHRFFYLTIKDKLLRLQYDETTMLRLKRDFFVRIRGSIQQEAKGLAGKSPKECMQRIKDICSDSVVIETINDYPVKQLGIPQRTFLWLLRRKAAIILYFAMRLSK